MSASSQGKAHERRLGKADAVRWLPPQERRVALNSTLPSAAQEASKTEGGFPLVSDHCWLAELCELAAREP
jgi:hypothetical protein